MHPMICNRRTTMGSSPGLGVKLLLPRFEVPASLLNCPSIFPLAPDIRLSLTCFHFSLPFSLAFRLPRATTITSTTPPYPITMCIHLSYTLAFTIPMDHSHSTVHNILVAPRQTNDQSELYTYTPTRDSISILYLIATCTSEEF